MDRLHRLLLIAFLASFTAILVERGIYFYTDHRLGFTPSQNLWLALGVGVTYIIGALLRQPPPRPCQLWAIEACCSR